MHLHRHSFVGEDRRRRLQEHEQRYAQGDVQDADEGVQSKRFTLS